MPTAYYYWTHSEYQRLQQAIAVVKGRPHQTIIGRIGRSEESNFVKYYIMDKCDTILEEYKNATMSKV